MSDLERGGKEMTLPLELTPTKAMAKDPWADLKAPIWRAFSFETGHFLLHVPSSHVIEVPEAMVRHVRGAQVNEDMSAELAALARDLPVPPPRVVTPDIQAVSLNMAQGCNLRCTYCFAGEGDYGVKGMMTAQTATSALTLFSKNKDRFHVVFFGGEPMLNFGVIQEVVDWCETQTCKFSFAITTNGTLLTHEKLAWLKAKQFSMTLSYDGKGLQSRQRLNKDKQTNSEQLVERKVDTFGEQLKTLKDVVIRATVTRENLDHLEHAMVTTLTAHNFKLAVAHHATPLRAFQFTDQDIEKLGSIFKRVVDRLVEDQDWEKLLKLDNVMKHVKSIHKGRTNLRACGAGVNYLTVSVEGDFYLCHRFNEDQAEMYGSIAKGVDQERLSEVAAFRGAAKDPCKSCWIRQWCAGGCMHEHKSATGNKFDIGPMYCKLLSLEVTEAMRVYTVLQQQAPHLLD